LKRAAFIGLFHDFDPQHIGYMSAGQNHSNIALNTRPSAPRYDTWYKIQVLKVMNTKKSHKLDGKVKSFKCKARESLGMRRT